MKHLKFNKIIFTALLILQSLSIYSQEVQKFLFTIQGQPEGAYVSINGQSVGTTPLSIEVVPGTHEIQLEHSMYKTLREEVEVVEAYNYNYEMKRAVATVELISNPPDATVTVDGFDFDNTPSTIRLYYGNHVIRYKRPEYEEHELRILIDKDMSINLPFTDFIEPAYISVLSDPLLPNGEEVFINGELAGISPLEEIKVYGNDTLISIGGIERTIQMIPGNLYSISPNSFIPPDLSGSGVSIPGYNPVEPRPPVLPEFRFTDKRETVTTFNGPTAIFGSLLSLALGGAVSGIAIAADESVTNALIMGGSTLLLSELAVLFSSLEREEVSANTRIDLERNIRVNERNLGKWEKRTEEAIEENLKLVEPYNRQRGEWEIRESQSSTE